MLEDEADEDDDVCLACGEETDDTLVICDSCEREFCTLCLAKALGGARVGWKAVQELLACKDPWKCPCCESPTPLKEMIQYIQHEETRAMENRTEDVVVEELMLVHAEYEDTIAKLEKKSEIRQEIMEEVRKEVLDANHVEEEVEKELLEWEHQLLAHCERVAQHESFLQDEIETKFDIDLSRLYEHALGCKPPQLSEEDDPDWVRKANLVLKRRDKELRSRPIMSRPVAKESYDDVEILLDSDDESRPQSMGATQRGGFATTQAPCSVEEFAEAKRLEEMYHPEVLHAKKATEKDDRHETEQEEFEACANGIRSDQKLHVSRQPPRRGRVQNTLTSGTLCEDNRSQTFTSSGTMKDTPESGPDLMMYQKKGTVTNRGSIQEMPSPKGSVEVGEGTKYNASLGSHNKVASKLEITLASPPKMRNEVGKRVIFDPSYLPATLKHILKDHQMEGINFLWKNCFTNDKPGGSILAVSDISYTFILALPH